MILPAQDGRHATGAAAPGNKNKHKIINMPYSYHKEGDKYVVTKKDTGKVVGHTKGTKEALNKYLTVLHINANEGKTNEASTLTKVARKILWDKIRTPKEFATQVKELPDRTLIIWAKDAEKNKAIPNTPLAFQQKLVKIEMSKRGLNLNSTGMPFESKNNTMKKSELTNMIQEIIKEVISEQSISEKLSYKSLVPNKVYHSDFKIEQGPMKGKSFTTDQEFIEDDGQNLIFKIVKIYTPETANYLGNKVGDKVRTGKGAISIDYSQLSEQTNTTPKHKIIAQLMGPDFFLSKKPENTWDEKDHDVFNRISKMASEEGKVPKISESADYDTAVAFRLVAKGNRDAALEALQTEINKVTGPMGRFSKVKVTIIPSKGNPQDIIIKLNGPSAFSMGKDITAKDKTKAYTNPTIRNNFVKVSPYTPQLTKIS